MRNRGLLTQEDRKVVVGEKNVGEERISDIKWNIQQRVNHIDADLKLLREAGGEWEEIVDDFYAQFSRYQDLEQRIQRLEKQLQEE